VAVKCPRCQFDNPEDTLYCGKCGTRIRVDIPDSLESGKGPQNSGDKASFTKTLGTPAQELRTGTLFAGRYQIIEELGHGGMGRVYRALDTKVKEEVALKLIRPEIAQERKTLERFQNELKTARRVSHRHVGRMYELMEEKGTHFITMEYVPGEDLKSAI
jgi:serine/threonine-protein kinase